MNLRTLLPLLLLACPPLLPAREWRVIGREDGVESEFVAMGNGFVVLRGPDGTGFEIPLENFRAPDQAFLRLLGAAPDEPRPFPPAVPVTRRGDFTVHETDTLRDRMVEIPASSEWRVSGGGDALSGSFFHFTAANGWLFLDGFRPSEVRERLVERMMVNGSPADPDMNLRVARHGSGSVVIPQGPDFHGLELYPEAELRGAARSLACYQKHTAEEIGTVGSFLLRRGFMATLAEHEDGTGFSRCYVAQDHDVVIRKLPEGLAGGVRFARVFPWQWTAKKGIAGGIHEGLELGWFYDWNIEQRSSPDLEYVAIKQKHGWPSLAQDWRAKCINHLLGFNEPDRPDQANMDVETALRLWPELLGTGLRLGSPAPSDGGLGWLYEFMDKADERGLRVDFVAVHYYRAIPDPGNEDLAAAQLRGFLEGIHRRTGRPLWVTEWNNGANWTQAPDPDARQQQKAIAAMIVMMDEAPFVERYALYNWVEECRELKRGDGSLTPAGEAYRDQRSPVFFVQPEYGE